MSIKKRRKLALGLLCLGLVFSSHGRLAWASGAIELLAAPITLGAPTTTYPNAFSGVGLGAQLDYYVNLTPWGIVGGILSQGNGKLEYLSAKYYFIGHPQFERMGSEAKATSSLVTESKSRGFYAEIGVAPYQLTSDTTTSSASIQQSISGVGAIGSLGLEQPFFWGTFVGLKADFFSSLGSTSVDIIVFNVAVGIPFSF